jgi:hypothetical protein
MTTAHREQLAAWRCETEFACGNTFDDGRCGSSQHKLSLWQTTAINVRLRRRSIAVQFVAVTRH